MDMWDVKRKTLVRWILPGSVGNLPSQSSHIARRWIAATSRSISLIGMSARRIATRRAVECTSHYTDRISTVKNLQSTVTDS